VRYDFRSEGSNLNDEISDFGEAAHRGSVISNVNFNPHFEEFGYLGFKLAQNLPCMQVGCVLSGPNFCT
jgi:hypothetical protein